MYNPEDCDSEEREERRNNLCNSLIKPEDVKIVEVTPLEVKEPEPLANSREYKTAIYTRKALKRYYDKNREKLIKNRVEKHQMLKTDEEYLRKRREYAISYYYKKKAERLNKIENPLEEIKEEVKEEFFDCLENI
jgi:hypothetical protein